MYDGKNCNSETKKIEGRKKGRSSIKESRIWFDFIADAKLYWWKVFKVETENAEFR